MKSIKISLAIIAIIPLLFSCERENLFEGQDSELKYSVNLLSVKDGEKVTMKSAALEGSDGTEIPMSLTTVATSSEWYGPQTKGQLVNDNENGDYSDIPLEKALSTFYLAGWNSDHSAFVPAWTAISWNDSKWAAGSKYYWKKNDIKTFYAYANLATGASVECKNDGGLTMKYTLPLDATAQKDILLGYGKSNGLVKEEPGIAELGFSHPLTAIIFRRGILKEDRIIKSIKIRGVAASGSVSMGADGSLSSWTATDFSANVYQTKDGGLPVDDTKIMGEPFIIIPQNTADHKVFVEIETTSGFRMEGVVNADNWKPGTTNIYTVGYGESTHELILEADNTIKNHSGGMVNFKLTTKVTVGSDPATAVMWKMQYSEDATTWHDFDDDNYPSMTGPIEYPSGFSEESANSIMIKQASLTNSVYNYNYTKIHDALKIPTEHITADLKSVWDYNVGKLSNNLYGGETKDNPLDLSERQINGDSWGTHNTANCYVVRGYGYFCLPLVYGNAIKGNMPNEDSYFPGTPGELARFKSSVGYITSPYIEKNDGIKAPFRCRYVWQDVCEGDEIVLNEDMEIIDHPEGGLDCQYLMFHISDKNIKEGNVILAVTDSHDNILWSWHIWVTAKDFVTTPTSKDKGIEFLNYNLGWTDGARGVKADRPGAKCYVRIIANDGSDAVSNTLTLERQNGTLDIRAAGPAGPYYQWGRKDPQKPADSVVARASEYNTQRQAFSGDWTMSEVGSYNMEYAISHPHVCLFNTHKVLLIFDQGNWYNEGEVIYRNLWSATNTQSNLFGTNVIGDDEKPIKTVYDPCPAGFQVPWGNAFYWLNHSSSTGFLRDYSHFDYDSCPGGCIWDDNPNLFFPAAGAIDHDDFALKNVGSEGHYWTAVPQDFPLDELNHLVQGQGMAFSVGLLYTLNFDCTNVSRQDYGCSIRPVKDLDYYN